MGAAVGGAALLALLAAAAGFALARRRRRAGSGLAAVLGGGAGAEGFTSAGGLSSMPSQLVRAPHAPAPLPSCLRHRCPARGPEYVGN